ncbi:MAG: hypothetical protein QOE77_247 [Blastocatellia bacterium]|nr:hypothetical protein [Blastocatellia bacterium]
MPVRLSYQIPGSAQRLPCEPRQAGNGATVATAACVAGKSGVWPNCGAKSGRLEDHLGRPFCIKHSALLA